MGSLAESFIWRPLALPWGLTMPIATTGEHTGVQTFVCIVEITVIAFLDAIVDHAIATARHDAAVQASIGIVIVRLSLRHDVFVVLDKCLSNQRDILSIKR